MSERTKGPWRVRTFGPAGVIEGDQDKDGWTTIGSVKYRPDAAAIVRWENHFDDLVKALNQALRQWAMYADIVEQDNRTLDAQQSPEGEMYRSAKALLAKVKACPEK